MAQKWHKIEKDKNQTFMKQIINTKKARKYGLLKNTQ